MPFCQVGNTSLARLQSPIQTSLGPMPEHDVCCKKWIWTRSQIRSSRTCPVSWRWANYLHFVWFSARSDVLGLALKCHFRKPFQVLTWSRLSYDSVPKTSQTFKYVFSFLVFFNIWCFLVGDGGGNCPPCPSASYGHVQPLLLRFLALLVQTFTSLSGGSPSSTSAISSDKSPSL